MRQLGLTLVELLVVLLIVGLGWFSLLPRLDLTRDSRDSLQEINILLRTAGEYALKTNTLQRIYLDPGRDYLEWNEQRYKLPDMLARAGINGQEVSQRTFFQVYPSGYMDQMDIVLADGAQLSSSPLTRMIVKNP